MHKLQAIQPKSWYLTGIISLAFALLIGSFTSTGGSLASAQAQGERSSSMQSPAHVTFSSEALQPFVGEWHFHTTLLTVGSDGYATFIARAYQFCGPGVSQPCDTWQGNAIISGIQENIILTKIEGSTAYGMVTSSTDNKTNQQVTLTLQPNNMLAYNGMLLCGPQGPIGSCGA